MFSWQTLLMVGITTFGVLGSFMSMPFIGLAVYIEFAILRPQHLWKWALPDWSWSYIVAMATIAATILDTLYFGRRSGTYTHGDYPPAPIRVNWGHLCFLLFGFWIFVCKFTAKDPNLSDVTDPKQLEITARDVNMAHDEYLKMYVICILAWWLVRRPQQAWTFVWLYFLGIGYIAFEVNMMYFRNGRMDIYHNGYGGLDNNGAAVLLALAIPICVFLWEKYRGWYRWVFAAGIPVIAHAIMLTFSRGALVAVVLSAPLSLFLGRQFKMKLLGLACLTPVLAYAAGPELVDRYLLTTEYKTEGSAQSRFQSWKAAFGLAMQEPIHGYGTRQSPLFIKSRDSSRDFNADIEGRIVHNQYLQVAADNGFIGAAFYMGSIAAAFWGYWVVIRRTRRDTSPEAERLYFTACAFSGALFTFCVGASFLSLEAFEPQYYLIFIGLQLPLMLPKEMPGLQMQPPAMNIHRVPPRQNAVPTWIPTGR